MTSVLHDYRLMTFIIPRVGPPRWCHPLFATLPYNDGSAARWGTRELRRLMHMNLDTTECGVRLYDETWHLDLGESRGCYPTIHLRWSTDLPPLPNPLLQQPRGVDV